MIYAYSEKFLLSISHDEVVHMKGSLYTKMPGDDAQKLSNLRLAYGYQVAHPGKNSCSWDRNSARSGNGVNRGLDWELLEEDGHKQLQSYMKELLKLYKTCPALYENDFNSDGFEWINCMEWEKNLLIFLRKTKKRKIRF